MEWLLASDCPQLTEPNIYIIYQTNTRKLRPFNNNVYCNVLIERNLREHCMHEGYEVTINSILIK